MVDFGKYLYKQVKVSCVNGSVFEGDVVSFGGSAQGEEEYGRSEDYISVYTGDAVYVLFRSEIENITEI